MTDDRLKLLLQAGIFALLIVVDVWMFTYLLNGLKEGDLAAEVSALLAAIVTAVTGALALGAKDFFDPKD